MKDLNELLQQFDDIQELPISEETVGAYIEGNLAGAELRDVWNFLNSDDDLSHIVDDINDIDMVLDTDINLSKWDAKIPNILSSNKDSLISASHDNNLDLPYVLGNGENIFDLDFGIIDTSSGNDIQPLDDTHNDASNSNSDHIAFNDLY